MDKRGEEKVWIVTQDKDGIVSRTEIENHLGEFALAMDKEVKRRSLLGYIPCNNEHSLRQILKAERGVVDFELGRILVNNDNVYRELLHESTTCERLYLLRKASRKAMEKEMDLLKGLIKEIAERQRDELVACDVLVDEVRKRKLISGNRHKLDDLIQALIDEEYVFELVGGKLCYIGKAEE